jgi:hypothetical protein
VRLAGPGFADRRGSAIVSLVCGRHRPGRRRDRLRSPPGHRGTTVHRPPPQLRRGRPRWARPGWRADPALQPRPVPGAQPSRLQESTNRGRCWPSGRRDPACHRPLPRPRRRDGKHRECRRQDARSFAIDMPSQRSWRSLGLRRGAQQRLTEAAAEDAMGCAACSQTAAIILLTSPVCACTGRLLTLGPLTRSRAVRFLARPRSGPPSRSPVRDIAWVSRCSPREPSVVVGVCIAPPVQPKHQLQLDRPILRRPCVLTSMKEQRHGS